MSDNTIPGISLSILKTAKKKYSRVPCLVLFDGDQMDSIYPIQGSSNVIGRGQQSTILLSNDGVSRQHARIDQHDENSFIITDLQSTNGTIVNEEPVSQITLKEGDLVILGEAALRFCFLDQAQLEMHRSQREKTVHDNLTNISNKQFFLEMLRKETSYCIRQRQPMTCLMLNIDRLQEVNKTFGNKAGDVVLQSIATRLQDGLRSYDILSRYEGNEFAILLRDTALDNALGFSDRIRERLASEPIAFEKAFIPISVSIGVASLNPDYIQDSMDLIREANRHLQTAKTKGGNVVCSSRTNV